MALLRVIIDYDPQTSDVPPLASRLNRKETRLYPFLYLVADQIVEAHPPSGTTKELPFVDTAPGEEEGSRPHVVDRARNGEGTLFTPSLHHKSLALQSQGLSPENAVLVLAAAGLEISVPNLTLNVARSDEVVRIRQKLVEEKEEYLTSILELADQAYNRLTSKVYEDTVDWALSEAFFKIRPKAEKYERAIKKLDRDLIKRVQLNFFKEGVPAIGSSIMEKGLKEGGAKAITVLLEVLCKNLVLRHEERKYPEVVYGFKVSKELRRIVTA